MKKINTFIYPIIRTDLIRRSLETLYRYTEPNFYVYVIDQSKNGIDKDIVDKYVHLYVRPHRNLGFAKATNTGFKLAETEYVTTCNDDVEFINSNWWNGILGTFKKVDDATPERPCALVSPSSLKLPDWSIGREKGGDFYILPYKEFYTDEDYDSLVNKSHYVNEHWTIQPGTVIDGITMYCSVFKKKYLDEIGWLSERYYPGSGEDYSWCCRANMVGYRSVGTTLSWIFHHWSKSFQSVQDEGEIRDLIDQNLCWNQTNEEWGDNFDLWGRKCSVCQEHMRCGKDKTTATCSKKHIEYKIPKPSKIPL